MNELYCRVAALAEILYPLFRLRRSIIVLIPTLLLSLRPISASGGFSFNEVSENTSLTRVRTRRLTLLKELCGTVVDKSFPSFLLVSALLFLGLSLEWLSNAFLAATDGKPANSHGTARVTILKPANCAQNEK